MDYHMAWKKADEDHIPVMISLCAAAWLLCTAVPGWTGMGPVPASCAGNLGCVLGVLLCMSLYGGRSQGRGRREYAGMSLAFLGATMILWPATQGLSFWLYHMFGSTAWEESAALAAGGGIAAQAFFIVVAAPLAEEFLTRHLFYGMLSAQLPVLDGALMLLVSVIFGLIHGNLVQAAPAVICGLFFCQAYRQGGLFLSFICHSFYNLCSILVPVLYEKACLEVMEGGAVAASCFIIGSLEACVVLIEVYRKYGVCDRECVKRCPADFKPVAVDSLMWETPEDYD